VSTHVTHDRPHLHDRLVSAQDGRLLPHVVTWVGADDPIDRRPSTANTAQATETSATSSSGAPERQLLVYLGSSAKGRRPAGWYLGGVGGVRVVFTPPADNAQGVSGATGSSPELHEGTVQQGLGRVRVRCSCVWVTDWHTSGKQLPTGSRDAWAEHSEHAVTALREAVRVAYATRALPQLSDTPALGDQVVDVHGRPLGRTVSYLDEHADDFAQAIENANRSEHVSLFRFPDGWRLFGKGGPQVCFRSAS